MTPTAADSRQRQYSSTNITPTLKPDGNTGSAAAVTDRTHREQQDTASLLAGADSPDLGPAASATPAFDLTFIHSDQQALATLNQLGQEHKGADIILVNSIDGLEQDNLSQRLTISATGHCQLNPGRLFHNPVPLVLVLDIRSMSANDIASFSELLDPDSPCLYNNQTGTRTALGAHVSIVVMASPCQLLKSGMDNNPGSDFWRRINRPENRWHEQQLDQEQMSALPAPGPECPEYPASAPQLPAPVTLDLHMHNDWRRLLYGGPGVDDQGRIRHIPGQLERLQPGQGVILKGANWSDLAFRQHIRQLQSRQHYQSNGQRLYLPRDVHFYQADVVEDELARLATAATTQVTTAPASPIIINQHNLQQWLNAITINASGYAVPNTTLEQQIRAGGTVTVTSPLSSSMWFLLLGQLQTIGNRAGNKTELFLAHPGGQPHQLAVHSQGQNHRQSIYQKGLARSPDIQMRTYHSHQQLTEWLALQESSLVIRITPQTRLGQLFDNMKVQSENTPRFGFNPTQLQDALSRGRKVVIIGLETNPELQHMLETLCCACPSMPLTGTLQPCPRPHICVLWPAPKTAPKNCASLLWQGALQAAQPLPESDIWQCAAKRGGIEPQQLPKTALRQLYQAFGTVPENLARQIGGLPALSSLPLDNLIIAAVQAQAAEGCQHLENRHWRKAINSVLLHGTRAHRAVHDFMKVACERLLPDENNQRWIDPGRLTAALQSLDQSDDRFIEHNFWHLARACGPGLFHRLELVFCNPELEMGQPCPLDMIQAMLAVHAPEPLRPMLAKQFQPDPELIALCQSLPVRSAVCRKRLQDALTCGWQVNRRCFPDGFNSTALADKCHSIARDSDLDVATRKQLIREALSTALSWQGQGQPPLKTLTEDLFQAKRHQPDREQRRLARLQEKLDKTPVVFIEGETATGKSHAAARLADRHGPAFITSLGPDTGEQELIQRWEWSEKQATGDRTMELQPQIMLQWARARPDKDDNYITLVLDEANLAREGTLNCLLGLWQKPACIYVDGQPEPVTDQHRVILTGNPANYGGRSLPPELRAKVHYVYYPTLDQAFLQDRVIEPTLRQLFQRLLPEEQAAPLANQTTASVLALWQHSAALLPGYRLTPRDLTDICAWIGCYLQQARVTGEVTQPQLNALVWQGFMNVLGAAIDEPETAAAFALECWFERHYPMDNSLSEQVRNTTLASACHAFASDISLSRPGFDSSSAAVKELVQALMQDLIRCQQAFQHHISHQGRQATLIEGPTGRGKDATLIQTLKSFQAQTEKNGSSLPGIEYLDGCHYPWETLRERIQHARQHGGILVISELNLIDSEHLEGELNAILAGDAHPGFHLFATTNPPHYAGRKPFSAALKGRFRYLPVRGYNQGELTRIAARMLPATPAGEECAARLADLHCRLRHRLQSQHHSLQPTARELQQLAQAIATGSELDQHTIEQLFNRHYRLYLAAASESIHTLTRSAATAPPFPQAGCDRELSRWLNQSVSQLSQPWLVQRGVVNTINPNSRTIIVREELDNQAARVEVIRQLASHQWQTPGMPPTLPWNADTLKQSLYICLQQHWFTVIYGDTGVAPEQVFPLNQEQLSTRAIPSNQPCYAAAARCMTAADIRNDFHRCSCWQQIEQMLPALHQHKEPLTESSIPALGGELLPGRDQSSASPSDTTASVTPAQSNVPERVPPWPETKTAPEQHRKQKKTFWQQGSPISEPECQRPGSTQTLDGNTDYERRSIPKKCVTRVFKNPKLNPQAYRLQVYELTVTPSGKIVLEAPEPGCSGMAVVTPGPLPTSGTLSLTDREHYGLINLIEKGQWHHLPGLTPNDTLTALRTQPERNYWVMKDNNTRLHILAFTNARPRENIQVHYILRTRRPRAQAGATMPAARTDAPVPEVIGHFFDQLFTPESLQKLPEKQARQLLDIQQAENQEQRIQKISSYCQDFRGQSAARGNDLLSFLIKEKQGSCRHRAAAFAAFCQYFSIPARIICNDVHAFPEFSLDGGASWASVELGGADARVRTVNPPFAPFTQGATGIAGSLSAIPFLKTLNTEQIRQLARVLETDPQTLSQRIAAGLPLPSPWPRAGIIEVVSQLWHQQDITAFHLGCELLNHSKIPFRETIALNFMLLAKDSESGPFAFGLPPVLRHDHTIIPAMQGLLQVYSQQKKLNLLDSSWNFAITSIALDITDTKEPLSSPAIVFLQMVLERGWLKPEGSNAENAIKLYGLLRKLENIDQLAPLVSRTQDEWYKILLGREITATEIASIVKFDDTSWCVPKIYKGRSPSLESAVRGSTRAQVWTDKPYGAPDIERLLSNKPAFQAFAHQGSTRHRPVILVDERGEISDWNYYDKESKAEALRDRYCYSHPKDKQLLDKYKRYTTLQQQCSREIERAWDEVAEDDLPAAIHQIESKYDRLVADEGCNLTDEEDLRLTKIYDYLNDAIEHAFYDYLFKTAHSHGGQLILCVINATRHYRLEKERHNYGHHLPDSAFFLNKLHVNMKKAIPRGWKTDRQRLLTALKLTDGVIINTNELETFYQEFFESIDIDMDCIEIP